MLLLAPAASAAEISFQTFGRDQGLASLDAACLAQDRTGFVFVCTENGLYRFDGVRFSTFGAEAGLPQGAVFDDLEIAPDGRIWAVLVDGIWLYRNGRFVEADPGGRRFEFDGDSQTALLGSDLLQIADGTLLRVASVEVGRPRLAPALPPALLRAEPALADLVSLTARDGTIWAGCGRGICRVRDGAAVAFGPAAGLPEAEWSALLVGRDGTLWARAADMLAELPAGATRFRIHAPPSGAGAGVFASERRLLRLAEAPDGSIVTQDAGGLLLFRDGGWRDLGRRSGLPPGLVTAMLFDRDGDLWIGQRGDGISRVLGFGRWDGFSSRSGLSSDTVWDILPDREGGVWIAGDGGLDRIVGDKVTHVPGLAGELYTVVRTRAGALVAAGVGTGVLRLDPADGRVRPLLPSVAVASLLLDRTGALWIGAREGLFRIADPDNPAARAETVRPGERVHAIREDAAGTLWVLGGGHLLHRDPDGAWHKVFATQVRGGGAMHALAFAQDGSLWVGGSSAGAIRLVLDGDRVRSAEPVLPRGDGSRDVLTLFRDRAGRMWIGSDDGLDVLEAGGFRHFDEDDGLRSNDVSEGAIAETPDGTMWIGTSRGVARLHDARHLMPSRPPRAVITGMEAASGPVADGGRIRAGEMPLVIRFAAFDDRHQRVLRFRTRLEGVDARSLETVGREVRYAALPAGEHVFDVVVIDPDAGTRSAPARIAFTVVGPWWKRWPAELAALVIGTACLLGTWRLREHMLRRRREALERLVAERTAELERGRLALLELSRRDSLTGLLSRAAVLELLQTGIDDAARHGDGLALALIDLDDFKRINDEHGHRAGDAVLREFARRLRTALRSRDGAGRYGGDELVAFFRGLDEDAAAAHFEALRDALASAPYEWAGARFRATCSIGAAFSRRGEDLDRLIDRADAALYAAKRGGRDAVVIDRGQSPALPLPPARASR